MATSTNNDFISYEHSSLHAPYGDAVKRNLSSLTDEAIDICAGKLFESMKQRNKPEKLEIKNDANFTDTELRQRKKITKKISELDNIKNEDDVSANDFVIVESQQNILEEFAQIKAQKEVQIMIVRIFLVRMIRYTIVQVYCNLKFGKK